MDLIHGRKVLAASIICVVFFLGLGLNASSIEYEKFEAVSNGSERVYEECSCYGSLGVRDSYPPQYDCQGYEMCSPTNYTRSRN